MQSPRLVTLTSAGRPVEIDLLERDDGTLLGLGEVRVDGVHLRDGEELSGPFTTFVSGDKTAYRIPIVVEK